MTRYSFSKELCAIYIYIFFQKCYEQKQYKSGLKCAKLILSNPKFSDHGGKFVNATVFCIVISTMRFAGNYLVLRYHNCEFNIGQIVQNYGKDSL